MKISSKSGLLQPVVFVSMLILSMCLSGCASAPGETKAEIQQRHVGIAQTQKTQIQSDWDAILLLDKSSRLSDMYNR